MYNVISFVEFSGFLIVEDFYFVGDDFMINLCECICRLLDKVYGDLLMIDGVGIDLFSIEDFFADEFVNVVFTADEYSESVVMYVVVM